MLVSVCRRVLRRVYLISAVGEHMMLYCTDGLVLMTVVVSEVVCVLRGDGGGVLCVFFGVVCIFE